MKALVLDGFHENNDIQAATTAAVRAVLADRGWGAEVVSPRELDLGPCTGCLGCWSRRPGMCLQEDDIHDLCRKIIQSDLLMILCPLTFGGYSSAVKEALDRSVGLISPLFTRVRGEVHHKPRYERIPAMAALGVDEGGCPRCREIFRTLVYRNAINLHTPHMAVDVADAKDLTGKGLEIRIARLLNQVRSTRFSELPVRGVSREEITPRFLEKPYLEFVTKRPRKALFLVGSPKLKGASTSVSEEFMFKLRQKGWETRRLYVLASLKDEENWHQLVQGVENADLVVLLSPLYVDSFPAHVTRALELLANHPGQASGRKRSGFMAVLNCAFPEAAHNNTALAIARHFAEKAGHEWLGGLSLGMGDALDGKPLRDCGWMVRNLDRALEMTAASVDRGEPVPPEAVDLMARPMFPRWLYIALGNMGWKRQARDNGIGPGLDSRPYEEGPETHKGEETDRRDRGNDRGEGE